jgi:hypothetical protein
MVKFLQNTLFAAVLSTITTCYVFAQLPPKVLIPATPAYEFFDTSCFIPSGPLVLPQAKVQNVFPDANIYPIFIPSNRYTWALSIAHAWNYTRNTLRIENKLTMDLWLSLAFDESQLACIPGTVWSPADRTSLYVANTNSIYGQDGCFQMENSGNWFTSFASETRYAFPTRFVNSTPYFYFNYYFERAALSMAYQFVKETQWSRYKYGVDPYAIAKNAADPLAMNKVFATMHNNGTASFSSIPGFLYNNRVALQTNACWPATGNTQNPAYVNKQGKTMSALQGLTGHCEYPGGATQKFADFNENIAWDTVQNYLNVIRPFYHEYSAAQWTALTTKVRNKFIQTSGSITTPIPFVNLGPVIDQIILELPKEDSTIPGLYFWPNNWDGVLQGWGPIVPTGKIGFDSDVVCLGTSYDLKAIVTGGDGPAATFKWYRNGSTTPFATTRDVTESPTIAGVYTYKLEICNASGCLPATCDITITVNNCGGCGMTVTPSTISTPCQNMKAGTINLNVTGSTNYTVNFTGPVSGSITSLTAASSITNVPNGVYNIEIINNITPSCKAYTTATVLFTTPQNAQLNARIISATQCLANVRADIVENAAPCLWTVNFFVPTYFDWSPAVNVIITNGTNAAGMYQANIQNPLVGWQEVRGKVEFYASTGDQIKIDLTAIPTPGASNVRPIYFEIVNASGAIVWSTTVPANTVNNTNIVAPVTNYTVTCPFVAPAYNFTWTPALTTVSNTTTSSTGTVNINFTVPRLYTVTAVRTSNPVCNLTDTIWIQPTCPTALPVQFTSFNVSLVNENNAQLNWSTSMEKNASYYEIERSVNGINFYSIGKVSAVGNSSITSYYQYLDLLIDRSKTTYYRIAQYDNDGTRLYTEIKKIESLPQLTFNVYPNPTVNNFNVVINGEDEDELISVILYDALGNMVEQKNTVAKKAITVGDQLAKGTYFLLIVKSKEISKSYKLVKQ